MENTKRGCPRKTHFIPTPSTPVHINPDYTIFVAAREGEWKLDLSKINSSTTQPNTNSFLKAKEKATLFGLPRCDYKKMLPFLYYHRNQLYLSRDLRQLLIVAHGENYSDGMLDKIASIFHHSPFELIQKVINSEDISKMEQMRICLECSFQELNYLENQLPKSHPIFNHIAKNRPQIYR